MHMALMWDKEPSTLFKAKRNWCETTIAISQSTKEAPGWRQPPRNGQLLNLKQLTTKTTGTKIYSNINSWETHSLTPSTKMLPLPSWCKNNFLPTNRRPQPLLLQSRSSRSRFISARQQLTLKTKAMLGSDETLLFLSLSCFIFWITTNINF